MRTANLWWGYKAREDGMILDMNNNILHQHMYGNYFGVCLINPETNRRKQYHVHRLIARALVFNPNRHEFSIVDHIDRNERHNASSNIRWVNNSLNLLNRDTKGAYFSIKYKKWEARVRKITYGWFDTYQEAHTCAKQNKAEIFSREYSQLCENTPESSSNSSLQMSALSAILV